MRLVNSELFLNIDICENKPTVLVLESPEVMTEVVETLYSQCNGGEGEFDLVENEKTFSLEKMAEVIINPFAIEFNTRKIQSRLYNELEDVESYYIEEKALLQSLIVDFLDKLSSHVPYEMISSKMELDLIHLLKMYDVKLEPQCNSILERLSEYAKVMSRLMKQKLLIIVAISHYLPPNEVKSLTEICNYLKLKVLFIETVEPFFSFPINTCIIDKDKCQILK